MIKGRTFSLFILGEKWRVANNWIHLLVLSLVGKYVSTVYFIWSFLSVLFKYINNSLVIQLFELCHKTSDIMVIGSRPATFWWHIFVVIEPLIFHRKQEQFQIISTTCKYKSLYLFTGRKSWVTQIQRFEEDFSVTGNIVVNYQILDCWHRYTLFKLANYF